MSLLDRCITDERSLRAVAKITGKGAKTNPVFVNDEFFCKLRQGLEKEFGNLVYVAHMLKVGEIHIMRASYWGWYKYHGKHFPPFVIPYEKND